MNDDGGKCSAAFNADILADCKKNMIPEHFQKLENNCKMDVQSTTDADHM